MENEIPISLFKSKTRQVLLRLFFTNPHSRYYVRQLQKISGISPGTLHRELKKMETAGLIKARVEGNLKFYAVNTDHPLFEDLKAIVIKTVGLAGSIKEALGEITGIMFAFIYGSYASGGETETSDIDLFIIGEFDEDLLNKKLANLEALMRREINYSSMTIEEFKQERREGSGFISDVLSNPRINLIGDDSELRSMVG